MTNETDSSILETYIESTFYECAISAQYTANIQVLFKIEDITQRMHTKNAEFAKTLLDGKKKGRLLIENVVKKWVQTQNSQVKTFFNTNDLHRTSLVLIQRNNITCTIDGQTVKHSGDSELLAKIDTAIYLLRYPLVLMEKLQRSRTGALLEIEMDASSLVAMANNFPDDVKELCKRINLLQS